jgi:hypothetical protein
MPNLWDEMTEEEYAEVVGAALTTALGKYKSTPESRERARRMFKDHNELELLNNTAPPTPTWH